VRLRQIRKRIAGSPALNAALARLFAGYVRFCHATTRWERRGFEALRAQVAGDGPVVIAIWHQRLMMAPYLFTLDAGPICSLTSAARAGRMAGLIQTRFGFETIAMSSHTRHVALSRAVLGRMKQGVSVGIAPDGANGPARVAKTFPIVWARSSGAPIFVAAYSARRVWSLPTWDAMFFPLPFTRGALVVRPLDRPVPRKLDEAQTEALRAELDRALDAVTAEADALAGRRG